MTKITVNGQARHSRGILKVAGSVAVNTGEMSEYGLVKCMQSRP